MRLTLLLSLVPVLCAQNPTSLPGTEPLTLEGDLAALMLAGIDRYLDRETSAAADRAPAAPDRERFRRVIGLVDDRVRFDRPAVESAELLATPAYKVHAVRWPVLEGVDAEGLLFEPAHEPVARLVAIPDADQTPEQASFAHRLAESGCLILVPALVSRQPTGIVNPDIGRPTNQPRREFLYRMAFEMGRHVIGYEVQKVLAAVDWFERSQPRRPVGVVGWGEGGLLALYAAAADPRINAALVSGYFGPRAGLWREPVYRNVWGLLREFGDASLARMIAPRPLIVDPSRAPEIAGPPPVTRETGSGAAPGTLVTPTLGAVAAEVDRARKLGLPAVASAKAGANITLVTSREGRDDPMSDSALSAFLQALGGKLQTTPAAPRPILPARERRPHEQILAHVQNLIRRSEAVRREFWARADASSVEKWQQTKELYRRHLWEEILGKLPPPTEPLRAESRLTYNQTQWKGYEVRIPVHPDVFAYGILLVPKDLRPGERRPVVVAQHGRAGRPQDLIDPVTPRQQNVYKKFAAQLADRGFVVYAPQNPYIFEEQYRLLQRKANPLKLSLFSFIAAQHERTLDWLSGLPFVDPARIGFYGLSYGGKTAMRIPPLLDRYALSICSGDFGEYIGKMASIDRSESFMFTIEHEMYEFNLGNTFNYSDLARLMAPRPFMVERGHNDPVGFDHWVAHEYAPVRRFYTLLGIPERTEIEFFDGVHEIHAQGTFRFLHRHLSWP
jgi:dienelactone hydrolase